MDYRPKAVKIATDSRHSRIVDGAYLEGGGRPPVNVTRKLAAIVYADVAGHSRLTGADEEGTHKTLSVYLDAITARIENHGGQVLHYAGDAILAEFASIVTVSYTHLRAHET